MNESVYLWTGLTRVYHTAWTAGDKPVAPWLVDNASQSDNSVFAVDVVSIGISGTFKSDFDAIPRPRAWVEYENAIVWMCPDGTVMIRS